MQYTRRQKASPFVASDVALVAAVTVGALALRLHDLTFQSLWRDEAEALNWARLPVWELVAQFSRPGQNGLAYLALLHSWLRVFGVEDEASPADAVVWGLRYWSVLWGTALVPAASALGARLLGRRVGLLAAVLAAASPYLIWYSQEGKMYAQLAALGALALLLQVRAFPLNASGPSRKGSAVSRGGMAVGITALTLGLSLIYVHFLGAFIVTVQSVWLLLWARRSTRRWRGSVRRMAIATCGAALLLGTFAWPVARWVVPFLQAPPPSGYPAVSAGDMAWRLLYAHTINGAPGGTLPVIPVALTLLLAAAFAPRPFTTRVGLASALLLPPVLLWAISLRYPLFTDRYVMVVAAVYPIALAAGILTLAQLARPVGAMAALALALLLAFPQVVWEGVKLKTDFAGAAAFVRANSQFGDRIAFMIPQGEPAFAVYAGPGYHQARVPYTNGAPSYEQATASMAAELAATERLWLVESEVDLWDGRRWVRRWLTEHGTLEQQAQFTGVEAVVFRLKLQPR